MHIFYIKLHILCILGIFLLDPFQLARLRGNAGCSCTIPASLQTTGSCELFITRKRMRIRPGMATPERRPEWHDAIPAKRRIVRFAASSGLSQWYYLGNWSHVNQTQRFLCCTCSAPPCERRPEVNSCWEYHRTQVERPPELPVPVSGSGWQALTVQIFRKGSDTTRTTWINTERPRLCKVEITSWWCGCICFRMDLTMVYQTASHHCGGHRQTRTAAAGNGPSCSCVRLATYKKRLLI